MSYGLSPFGQLCFMQQPSPLSSCSQPTPAVRITALPPRDPRNAIWAESCCMNCAKLVGSVDLFCVPCRAPGKCVRCFNLNLPCQPIPIEHELQFREVQKAFQYYDLQSAFEARRAWLNRINNIPSLARLSLVETQLYTLNRRLERLINLQEAKVLRPPVDADGKANGESQGDITEKAPKRRSEIQIQCKRKTGLEGLIALETAKYEVQTNEIFKQKIALRVQLLKRELALVETSIEK